MLAIVTIFAHMNVIIIVIKLIEEHADMLLVKIAHSMTKT
jgi:hypothetical protein